jgi:hypothetical protein
MTESLVSELVSDREKFNAFVYTPLETALEILKQRKDDSEIDALFKSKLEVEIPDVLKRDMSAVLFRQLATPNYEVRRFLDISSAAELKPVFFEYYNDKFTDNNLWKYHLGKICIFLGRGKRNGEKISRYNVIDFNIYKGKKISEVMTCWGQSLVDFHHELFEIAYKEKPVSVDFFDASDWFMRSGGNANGYYKNFLSLFIKHSILFENFGLDDSEILFTKEVFLPAFIKITELTGIKPLIVALEPTQEESNIFWMCHPQDTENVIKNRLNIEI